MLLEIKNISKEFDGCKVVDSFTLSIPAATITGLIGPNGAGKTMVFNLLTGVYPVTSGSAFLAEQDITNKSAQETSALGLARTFQNTRLSQAMTVFDNVRQGLPGQKKPKLWRSLIYRAALKREEQRMKDTALQLLEKFGLADRKNELAGNLSAGLQRKLEIVRALAFSPRVLLIDEPAAGLNVHQVPELMDFILQLKTEGLAIILIEHDMKLIMNICDNVAVLDHGIKIAEGVPQTVCADPAVIAAYLGDRIL